MADKAKFGTVKTLQALRMCICTVYKFSNHMPLSDALSLEPLPVYNTYELQKRCSW